MPLPLVAQVPSFSQTLYSLNEGKEALEPLVGGHWRIRRKIGQGSSGSTVFAAERCSPESDTGDTALEVALKLLTGAPGAQGF